MLHNPFFCTFRLCDEPRLYLLCLRRVVSDFKTVARSDGWRVMKETDPNLEQELVEAVIEADTVSLIYQNHFEF